MVSLAAIDNDDDDEYTEMKFTFSNKIVIV
jgi:hypothetical protein